MTFNEEELSHLRNQEKEIPPLYTVEGTSIEDIDEYFPVLQGKTFIAWLESFSKEGKNNILEIGGGIHQYAAQEILKRFFVSKYTALERRDIRPDLEQKLKEFDAYELFQAGISDIPDLLKGRKFSVIFANSVAEHLPQPISLARICYPLLNENGVMFFNGIPVTLNWMEKAKSYVEQDKLAYMKERTSFDLNQWGFVNVSIAVQKGDENPPKFLESVL